MNLKRKFGAMFLSLTVAISSLPATVSFAAADNIEVVFADVTATDQTTLSGEAKVKVSVKGAGGEVSIAQIALMFDGDLKYKSIEFLKGENNPAMGNMLVTPNAAYANITGEINTSIICAKTPIAFTDEVTDLFVLTFSGEENENIDISLDKEGTYCTVDGVDITADNDESIKLKSSNKANEGKAATVKLTMDKVTDFTAGGSSKYQSSNVELKITSETHPGYTIYTILNNTLVSKGGHRENLTIPTFTVINTVLTDDTYTVELTGIGYVPYKMTGVTFDEALEITNADFVPGDFNNDGTVDSEDKTACDELIKNTEYSEAADFNRDGKVDKYDLEVFDEIDDKEETASVPSKPEKPEVEGGENEITVEWKKPADNGSPIIGYIIKYGTSSAKLDETVEVKAVLEETITKLNEDTTYYVSVAAVNAVGTGEFSDIASAKTDEEESGGSGGGGGGGGSGGGGGAISTPIVTPVTPAVNPNEPFTDLGNYAWAKDSIYTLKNKGIISGVSETEYAPANNIRRGDFILILTRMLGINDEFNSNFADVPENSYYYEAIGRAKAAGIAQGSGDTFMPENSITRQDLITLCYRAFLQKGYIQENADISAISSFDDKAEISDYALSAMATMVNAGIIKGSDNKVNPKGNATRAEVAVMCARLLELIK